MEPRIRHVQPGFSYNPVNSRMWRIQTVSCELTCLLFQENTCHVPCYQRNLVKIGLMVASLCFSPRYGLSSCSPAYKCKWENTANQRRSSKLLYRLLMVGPWRVHSSSSQFSHVSGWSQGRWEHEMLWTYSHLYFIFRLRGRWLLHNFLRLSLWVEFLMKSIQFDE